MPLTLTWQERRELYQMLRPYLKEVSCWLNRRLHIGANPHALLVGALLHDFYLYDWHTDENHEHTLHGFRHPEIARQNARRYFHVEKQTQDVIRCHMWPLTLTQVPVSRAAILVCIADKTCSLYETLFLRRRKECTHA